MMRRDFYFVTNCKVFNSFVNDIFKSFMTLLYSKLFINYNSN